MPAWQNRQRWDAAARDLDRDPVVGGLDEGHGRAHRLRRAVEVREDAFSDGEGPPVAQRRDRGKLSGAVALRAVDHKPGDSQNDRFDTLFGARRWEYGPTGTWGPFARTNLISPGWRVFLSPTPSWTLMVKHRAWHLAQDRDFFGNTGLRDPTGNAGTSLGHDLELQAQWAVTSNLDFDVGYVHWFKGSYFDSPTILGQMPAGGNKDSDYFYASIRVRI